MAERSFFDLILPLIILVLIEHYFSKITGRGGDLITDIYLYSNNVVYCLNCKSIHRLHSTIKEYEVSVPFKSKSNSLQKCLICPICKSNNIKDYEFEKEDNDWIIEFVGKKLNLIKKWSFIRDIIKINRQQKHLQASLESQARYKKLSDSQIENLHQLKNKLEKIEQRNTISIDKNYDKSL